MNIYEQYGRLQEAYAMECEAHRQTVGVLRALKNGELDIEKVAVTNDNKWAIVPSETIPDEAPAN
jgi:hypothetical protein